MSRPTAVIEELDDWEVLSSFLPQGWEGRAREYGALVRARGVADAPALLRTLLIHIATGCSLAETAVRARQMGLARLNAAAVYKRLRSAEEWLRWLAEQMRGDLGMVAPRVGRRSERWMRRRCQNREARARIGESITRSTCRLCNAIFSN